MIKFYRYCKIKKNESINQIIKKINYSKNNENYYPVAVYEKNNIVKGILSLGDIRRIALNKINFNEPGIKYLNKKTTVIDYNLFNADLNNKLNFIKKKRKIEFDFIISKNKNRLGIVKISDIEYLQEHRKNCIIGVGHIGLPLLVYLSNKTSNITGYDISLKNIKNLKKGKLNFFEKNLKALLKQNLKNKKIFFSENLKKIEAQNYVICIGSDLKNKKIINKNLINVCKKIGPKLNKGDLVILRGTVQVGLSRELLIPILERTSGLKCGVDFNYAYMPERILEGDALFELKTLPQLISGSTDICKRKALNFAKFYFENVIELSSLEEAEIIKLATNSFRDLNFAFANEIARIASKYNLSGNKLIKNSNLGYDRNKISLPSIGVGGYCLPKDPILFSQLFKKSDGYSLGKDTRRINNRSIFESYKKIRLNCKKLNQVLIFGATFKGQPETIDLRNSPSIQLSQILKKQAVKVKFYDVMQKEIKNSYNNLGISFVNDFKKINDFDLVILANNHPKYIEIIEGDKGIKFNKRNKEKFIYDPWCLLNQDLIKELNWKYIGL